MSLQRRSYKRSTKTENTNLCILKEKKVLQTPNTSELTLKIPLEKNKDRVNIEKVPFLPSSKKDRCFSTRGGPHAENFGTHLDPYIERYHLQRR